MKPELIDWIEWMRRCARKLCGDDARARLGSFGLSRFGIHLSRQIFATNLKNSDALRQLPSADDAWHQFESFAALKKTREGKRYKDWIFARVHNRIGKPLDIIQSGATLIMRSVVRAHLRAEYAPRWAVSMDQPLGGSNLTMADLLPGTANPADVAAANEYSLLAEEYAGNLFDSLTRRERIGLLAKFNGISLDSPEVLEIAGCSKSTLSYVVRDMLTRLRDDLNREYRNDGHDSVMAFALLVVQCLEKVINRWKKLENNMSESFYKG